MKSTTENWKKYRLWKIYWYEIPPNFLILTQIKLSEFKNPYQATWGLASLKSPRQQSKFLQHHFKREFIKRAQFADSHDKKLGSSIYLLDHQPIGKGLARDGVLQNNSDA